MKKYNQLNLEQRYQIEALLKGGKTYTAIAEIIGVHKSTISRELARNVPKRGKGANEYNPEKAWRQTQIRHATKAKHISFAQEIKDLVVSWIKLERLTPELIYAKACNENREMVSHETIYRWIWEMKKSNRRDDRPHKYLYRYLKHGKRRQKRGRIKESRGVILERVSIEKRPAIVEKRKRRGDFEVDLMMGKNHKSALIVITDRATLKTELRKMQGKHAQEIANKIVQAVKASKMPVKTITFDNDQAFADHQWIGRKLLAKTFFTHPYTSQEKGTVENRIGVIMMFFPKKTDLRLTGNGEIRRVENCLNRRPIRKFNYRTPNQMYEIKSKCCTY